MCGFDARRGSPELQQVRLPVRFSRRRLRFSLRPILLYCVLGYSTLPWRYFYQTRANGCIETKFHHNECTQHVVPLHGGHLVPSALRSSTATVKAVVVWSSWMRRYPPQMRENMLLIRRQKATIPEDTCTNHPVCCIVGGCTWTRISRRPIIAITWHFSQQTLLEPLTVTGARAS